MSEENKFDCPDPECDKSFKEWRYMRNHVDKKHPELLEQVVATKPVKTDSETGQETPARAPGPPERVKVRFKGPGVGMLSGRQVLSGEIHEVSWPQYEAVSQNKRFERMDG